MATATPVYDQAFHAAIDHAIETGQEELLDVLERMNADTQPADTAPPLAPAGRSSDPHRPVPQIA